jgi:hypothetical protein
MNAELFGKFSLYIMCFTPLFAYLVLRKRSFTIGNFGLWIFLVLGFSALIVIINMIISPPSSNSYSYLINP